MCKRKLRIDEKIKKNKLVRNFYKDSGFEFFGEKDGIELSRYRIGRNFPVPDAVRLIEE